MTSMASGLRQWLYGVWYEGRSGGAVLLPLAWLFGALALIRRGAYRLGLRQSGRAGAPVIVIGNVSVGGGGKTPLVAWLARKLLSEGHAPAIVSRGYGGTEPASPMPVNPDSTASVAGDEAVMLARATGVPVYVCRDRLAAARRAVAERATVVIADDGLQHYRLERDFEIVVVDGERGHGNGRLLPAGPLREPVSRLASADLVVYAGGDPGEAERLHYQLVIGEPRNAATGERRGIAAFAGMTVHAVAGIAHPARFYAALEGHGLAVRGVPVADHGVADATRLFPADDQPVLMTEKDAVKYTGLSARHWVVPAEVAFDPTDEARISKAIDDMLSGTAQAARS